MPQYIDVDALVRLMNERHKTLVDENGWYDHYTSGYEDAITDVEEAPIVDAVPVVHGRWVDDDCSVCGFPIPTDDRLDAIFEEEVKYCYHCGAKMDAKEDNHAQTD